MKHLLKVTVLICLTVISKVYSQNEKQEKYSDAIEDNSFLIEEAYNQEERVVQHINTGQYFSEEKLFEYSFTQEWPAFGNRHQLSYTLPYSFMNSRSGIGDIMLNYRYQLFYKNDWACVSPRVSLIVPTGSKDKLFSDDAWGIQINIPVSKRLSEKFAAHFNAGLTHLFQAEYFNEMLNASINKDMTSYFGGMSFIWLANENLNLMLEYIAAKNAYFAPAGNIKYANQHIINPGIRYAININKLQIVPGISMPVTFNNNKTTFPVFLYLSFEHPY